MKNKVEFITIICLFCVIIYLQQCGKGTANEDIVLPQNRVDTIMIDTVFPPPIVINLPKQAMPEPIIIYRDKVTNETYTPATLPEQIDWSNLQQSYSYMDSLSDENLTIFYNAMTEGKMIDHDLSYKLKIPKTITKHIEKTTYVPTYEQVSGLFLTLGAGGNPSSFASIRVGAQYLNKNGWALGYDYDILQNIHTIEMGVRVFPFKNKK